MSNEELVLVEIKDASGGKVRAVLMKAPGDEVRAIYIQDWIEGDPFNKGQWEPATDVIFEPDAVEKAIKFTLAYFDQCLELGALDNILDAVPLTDEERL